MYHIMTEEGIKEILKENAREYYENALGSEEKGNYNTAVTLFFKSLAALCDLYIFIKEGKVPSSHAERFRILETKHTDVYDIVDKDFSFYQDSYTAKMNKEACEVLKKDVEELFKLVL